MKITDEFISKLFIGKDFGEPINKSRYKKRHLLGETLRHLVEGFWVAEPAFLIAINGGFIKDGKKNTPKHLTAFGEAFIEELNH